jgi:sugar/nucleoside kinase (ribokinase family)
MARYANTVAAIPVTRKGGIPSMPTLEKVRGTTRFKFR